MPREWRNSIEETLNSSGIKNIDMDTQTTACIVYAGVGVAEVVGIVALIGCKITRENEGNKRLLAFLVCFHFMCTETCKLNKK